jgi:hypothetical protein
MGLSWLVAPLILKDMGFASSSAMMKILMLLLGGGVAQGEQNAILCDVLVNDIHSKIWMVHGGATTPVAAEVARRGVRTGKVT